MLKYSGIAIGVLAVFGITTWYLAESPTDVADTQNEAPIAGASSSSASNGSGTGNTASSNASTSGSGSSAGVAGASSSGSPHVSAPLPEPIQRPKNRPPKIDLWQIDPDNAETTVDTIPATRASVSVAALNSIHVGQTITMSLPSLNRTVTAEVESTHNQLNNVEVFKGPITDGHPKDNVIITRGKTHTHVIVATREGTFTAVVDNQTGAATVTDEGDINARAHQGEDGISYPGLEMPTPETAQNP